MKKPWSNLHDVLGKQSPFLKGRFKNPSPPRPEAISKNQTAFNTKIKTNKTKMENMAVNTKVIALNPA